MDQGAGGRRPREPRRFYRRLADDLIAFGEHAFRLAHTESDGRSYREHLEGKLARAELAGRAIDGEALRELEGPPFPLELESVWEAFVQLSAARASTGFGPAAITFGELEAFQRLTGDRLTPFEVALLRELDGVYLRVTASGQAPPARNAPGK